MKFFKSAILVFTLIASTFAQAQEKALDNELRSRLQQEIEYIGSLYSTFYAPKAWKESHLGWDLMAQLNLAQAKLAAAQNLREAREAVATMIRSTADYHVAYSFYSTERASLPFQVKTVEGKTLIVFIDRTKMSEKSFPFQEGDELLTLGSVPVAQAVSEIGKVLGANVPETDQAMADLFLTRRSGRLNFQVPRGPVTVSIKRASDGSVGTIQLAWEYKPELLNNRGIPFTLARQPRSLFDKKMKAGITKEFMADSQASNLHVIGAKKSFVPDFGTRIWEAPAESTFDAYIFHDGDGRDVGVIRIFSYEVDDYQKAVKDFASIIEHMEKTTHALIIEQNNNPGGSVFYLYSLASMLSEQVLTVPKHRIALLHSEAKECVEFLEKVEKVKTDEDAADLFGGTQGYPATYQLAMATQDFCQSLVKQYQAGKGLSEPLHLWGVDKINPNPIHYTKPMIVLVNQLDFSGGDFFPAIMQDNKRATIVGTRTAGAGGYVLEAQFPSNFGLENIAFTGSIAERLDLKPIENLGVTPDVALPMTVEDYRNGFQLYRQGVLKHIRGLIK